LKEAERIIFIQMGGTIDKEYPRKTQGWGFEIVASAIPRIMGVIDPPIDFEVITIAQKDSQHITDGDRADLVHLIKEREIDQGIITHGTDTLIETALYLSANCPTGCYLLTGAMLPERFKDSDASLNIGMALGALRVLAKGTYIAMHGDVIPVDECSRDPETGRFRRKSS